MAICVYRSLFFFFFFSVTKRAVRGGLCTAGVNENVSNIDLDIRLNLGVYYSNINISVIIVSKKSCVRMIVLYILDNNREIMIDE